MKINLKFLSAAVLTVALMATPITAMAAEDEFGSAGATVDTEYTLEEMLIYAIQDEYMAQAEYNAILAEYGVQSPFSNIVKAEAIHIGYLIPLFETYNYALPENDAATRTVLPATIAESYTTGVQAEINNIAMYDEFLNEELPEDVRIVFEKLKSASVYHQAAFERAAGGDLTGIGAGNGIGNLNGNGIGNTTGNINGNMNKSGALDGTGNMNKAGSIRGNLRGAGGTAYCSL
jgi:hypothetical protein